MDPIRHRLQWSQHTTPALCKHLLLAGAGCPAPSPTVALLARAPVTQAPRQQPCPARSAAPYPGLAQWSTLHFSPAAAASPFPPPAPSLLAHHPCAAWKKPPPARKSPQSSPWGSQVQGVGHCLDLHLPPGWGEGVRGGPKAASSQPESTGSGSWEMFWCSAWKPCPLGREGPGRWAEARGAREWVPPRLCKQQVVPAEQIWSGESMAVQLRLWTGCASCRGPSRLPLPLPPCSPAKTGSLPWLLPRPGKQRFALMSWANCQLFCRH